MNIPYLFSHMHNSIHASHSVCNDFLSVTKPSPFNSERAAPYKVMEDYEREKKELVPVVSSLLGELKL